MLGKLKTLVWFARRPSFWPFMAALAGRKLTNAARHEAARGDATRWAADRAKPVAVALAAIGLDPGAQTLDPALIAEGEAAAARSKVAMGGPGDLDLLYQAILAIRARRVVETGVAYGWSSLAALAALDQTDGKLVSVDMPYVNAGNEAFVGIVVPDRFRARWTLIRMPDRPGIRRALGRLGDHIDLAHYDSDKSYPGRRYAYPLLWDALRPGGVFISDDIQDNFAFRDFVTAKELPFAVTESGGKYVGILRKPG